MPDNCYGIGRDDNVLFVGEGNFSLCNDLILSLSQGDVSREFTKIRASCFEDRQSSSISKEVEDNLTRRGVKLLFGIDATMLENYPSISHEAFDKIIFNFPHVGGKMKIQLNRALLRNYFVSAEKLLAYNGRVMVTLCAGQGGTSEEIKPRRYDDTWKVVEMAAEGQLVLKRVTPWPADVFPNYRPIGFRSQLRAFRTEAALVHEFSRGVSWETWIDDKSIELLDRLVCLEGADNLEVAPCFDRLIKQSPFLVRNSPQNFLLESLKRIAVDYAVDSSLPLTNGQSLRESLYEVAPRTDQKTIFYGLVFSKVNKKFDLPLANCQVLLIGNDAQQILLRLSDVLNTDISPACEAVHDNARTLFLDSLCSTHFKVNAKQLWASGVVVNNSAISLPSLCPTRFVYDISFESEGSADEDRLWHVLHQVPGDLIDSVQPALCKQRVVEYQRNVLGRALERLLNVRVR